MEYVIPEKFLNESTDIKIVDVRSPGEYLEGHIPQAANIPLFTDRERAEVGKLYKNIGKLEAIKKGLSFVGPRMEKLAKQALEQAIDQTIKVYCWRGGMRSEKMAWLFELVGLKAYVLKGGYKAYRKYILDSFKNIPKLVVIHGPTGSGKTDILKYLRKKGEQVLDLEELASHRGSAFGAIGMGSQPPTQVFQNNLYVEFEKFNQDKLIWVEGESMSIGKVYLPETLWESMNSALVIKIVMKRELRAERLVNDYGSSDRTLLAESIKKISKRFGKNNVLECIEMLEKNDLHGVAMKLLDYYDKTYTFSLEKYKKHKPMIINCESSEPSENGDLILREIKKTSF
ncbi:tRNA 2-selenouridine(34) synthase MnmH [Bacteroidota bacterium]